MYLYTQYIRVHCIDTTRWHTSRQYVHIKLIF